MLALYAMGITPASSAQQPSLDADLIYARALRGQVPYTWQVFRGNTQFLAKPGAWVLFVAVNLSLFAALLFVWRRSAITPRLTGALMLVALVLAWRLSITLRTMLRSLRRPEMLVVTPEGCVVRRFNGSAAVEFGQLADLRMGRQRRRGHAALLVTPASRQVPYEVALDARFGLALVVTQAILRAYRAYGRGAQDMTATSAGSTTSPLIFISHAREDHYFVDGLESRLQNRGLATWVDRGKLIGGQQWPLELRQAIEACAVLLVVVSRQAMASAAVRQEYEYALRLGKPVIPVIEHPAANTPDVLRQIEGIHYRQVYSGKREGGDYALFRALDHVGIRPRTADGLPALDGPLVLAHACLGSAPDDWRIYRIDGGFVAIALLEIVALPVIACISWLLSALPDAGQQTSALLYFCIMESGFLALGIFLALLRRSATVTFPNLLVLTPEGWAVKHLGTREWYAYRDLASVRKAPAFPPLVGALRLRVVRVGEDRLFIVRLPVRWRDHKRVVQEILARYKQFEQEDSRAAVVPTRSTQR
ncbi:MAG: toll/interleukin-1 receptor domain-containing protein [Ktedonobacterales bacterium]